MAVVEHLPQPKLQGFLKELRSLLEHTGDNEVGEEILYILFHTVTSCSLLLSEYKRTVFSVSEKTAYLKENTALTEDQILSLMEPHFDALYASGYRFLGTTSETVRYAVSGMQDRIKAGITTS